MRQAWEKGDLRSLVKNAPIKATNAHVSILGHAPLEELRRSLKSTEQANGFGNRFLWLCVKRSKLLPDGGWLPPSELEPLAERFRRAARCAGRTALPSRPVSRDGSGEPSYEAAGLPPIGMDEAARRGWERIYEPLSAVPEGLTGCLLARAEAQVRRLACLYAVLDESPLVRLEHLKAAVALWQYAGASVEHVFGQTLGDVLADDILQALRASPMGMTRTDIHELVGRNRTALQIDRALGLLAKHQLAVAQREATGGRPATRWTACGRGEPT